MLGRLSFAGKLALLETHSMSWVGFSLCTLLFDCSPACVSLIGTEYVCAAFLRHGSCRLEDAPVEAIIRRLMRFLRSPR